ncbi:MAG: hypothetical protein V1742_12035, partial [Pseudomonadota bacterium]
MPLLGLNQFSAVTACADAPRQRLGRLSLAVPAEAAAVRATLFTIFNQNKIINSSEDDYQITITAL